MTTDPPLPEALVASGRLDALRSALGGGTAPVVMAVHDYPDPDAIASAMAFQTLARSWGVDSVIAHGGGSGRPENMAMVKLLRIETILFSDIPDLGGFRGAFFLDTQPAAQNQSLPGGTPVVAVIDHHRLGGDPARPAADPPGEPGYYADIRLDIGSTSTLAFAYLAAAGIVPDARLATALFLGIKTDTADLMRDAAKADVEAYGRLVSLADLPLAAAIASPSYDREHFRFIHDAMENAKIYSRALVADCGDIAAPDLISYVSDDFIRGENVYYALAHGRFRNRVYLSLRAKPPREDAAGVLLAAIGDAGRGGGHALSAGGFMDLRGDWRAQTREMKNRFLAAAGCAGAAPEPMLVLRQV